MACSSHLLAEHFIPLLFLVSVSFGVFIILDLVLSVDILAIGLPELLVEFTGSDLIGYISGHSALNVIEFAETFESNNTLNIFLGLLLSSNLGSVLLLHLVLSEDVGGAGRLRCWASLASGMCLFKLLERASLEATSSCTTMVILTCGILIKSITDSLSKSIDSGIARGSLRLLITDALIVAIWIESLCSWRELDRATLSRHLTLATRSSRSLTDICAASLRDGIVFTTSTSVWPGGHVMESGGRVSTSTCEHRIG